MTATCWILALLGAIIAWIIFLADAMSSGPGLDRISVVILALPLPVLASALSAIRLYRIFMASDALSIWSLIAAGAPLLIGISTLAILVSAFFIRGS
jgi:hypothetical protein